MVKDSFGREFAQLPIRNSRFCYQAWVGTRAGMQIPSIYEMRKKRNVQKWSVLLSLCLAPTSVGPDSWLCGLLRPGSSGSFTVRHEMETNK